MNKEDLEEYLDKIIKPALEEYAKENNITMEELLQQLINKKDNNKKTNPLKK